MPRPSADTIALVPLFAEFERRELERVADAFKERRFSAGDAVATEGQKGAGFFVIGEGTATVTVGGAERGKLGPGDYFGEVALIDEGARTATITADSDMTCYGMTFWEFRPFVESDARVAWKLLQALAKKLRTAEQRETS
jgi:CRP-like cAMP-binding protein